MKLNERISILTAKEVIDEIGCTNYEYVETYKWWASVKNMSGTEVFKANMTFSKRVTRFIIRYQKNIEIDTHMKIKYNNEIYNITYVNKTYFEGKYIEIIAEWKE